MQGAGAAADPLTITGSNGTLPLGTWTDLKFRVKNVDLGDDDDDEDDAKAMTDLAAKIRGEFPDWPRKAVMVVTGSFKGSAATDVARPFTTYFDGQIKIRMSIDPALEITAAGASRTITVELDPSRWFMLPDGRVRDLSTLDFHKTKLTVRFDTELERGFVHVRAEALPISSLTSPTPSFTGT